MARRPFMVLFLLLFWLPAPRPTSRPSKTPRLCDLTPIAPRGFTAKPVWTRCNAGTNDRDDQDPELVSGSITPEAHGGTELTATFEVNEPVMVDQRNVYFEGGLSFEYDEAASDPDAITFVFKRTLTGEEQAPNAWFALCEDQAVPVPT